MASLPGLIFSVSHTTRPPRPDEKAGIDYHFVSRRTFESMRDTEPPGFLEWAEVHGHLYGTGRKEVEQQLVAGRDVILDIDVQGAMQVQQNSAPVSVFIVPPSMEELEARLRTRGTESGDELRVRLANAAREIEYSSRYDYLIVNDRLEEAVDCLRSIMIAERSRRRRSPAGLPLQVRL